MKMIWNEKVASSGQTVSSLFYKVCKKINKLIKKILKGSQFWTVFLNWGHILHIKLETCNLFFYKNNFLYNVLSKSIAKFYSWLGPSFDF